MSLTYDKDYETPDLFGKPYDELINFFTNYPQKGNVLDLGCGQGRDAIPLARLGYHVTGVDFSKVGIEQMMAVANTEQLNVKGQLADIYTYSGFEEFDFILLDSMFHFYKKDKKKEAEFIKRILLEAKPGCNIIFCIQDSGKKANILLETIELGHPVERLEDVGFQYTWIDPSTGHSSISNYRMIVVRKRM